MTLQTRELVMVALGAESLFPEVEDGVHLRWQMDLALGFPPYGFDVFRRPHQSPVLTPIAVQVRPDGSIPLGAACRAIRLRLRWPGGAVVALGRFAGDTMTSVTASGGAGTEIVLELAADALDEVLVLPGTVVLQAQATRVSHDALIGWGPALNGAHRIGLPLTDAAYAVTHAHAPDDWAEAAARLGRCVVPGGPVTLPAELAARFGGQNFQDLQGALRHIGANGPSPFPAAATGAGSPRMEVNPAALLGLLAIDPDFARILGLLRVDRSAVSGTRYDYKVVGYWSPGSTTSQVHCTGSIGSTPGTSIEPGTVLPLPPGTTTSGPLTAGTHARIIPLKATDSAEVAASVTVAGVPANRVIEASSPWGHARGIDLVGLKESPLRLALDRETGGAILYTSSPNEVLRVTARDADGKAVEVGVKQENVAGEYTAIHVTGTRIVTIEVNGPRATFFGICTFLQTISGDTREWICFGARRAATAALEPPGGVSVTAVPRVDPDDSLLLDPAAIRGQHGLAAALSWALPSASTSMLARGAVTYHVFRRNLGNGATPPVPPPGSSLAGFSRLTEDGTGPHLIPVPVRPAKTQTPRSRPAGWPSTPVHYVDETATDRWYAYAVQGVDVFGRRSAPTIVTAELKDLLPPPPPAATSTTFIDGALSAGDPEYVPALQAMIPVGADSLLLVDWEWPPSHYRAAPDVAEFRVYWQPTRLNALTGEITSVVDHGDTSNATVTLDGGQLSVRMTDGWLRLGSDFFRIIGSTTGAAPVLTVKNLRMTRTPTGAPTPPGTGRCSIAIGGGDRAGVAPDPNFKDYRVPAQWAARLAAVPVVQPFMGRITSIAAHSLSGAVPANGWHDNGDGTSSVALGRLLRKADGLLRGGAFSIGGEQYVVLANSEGPAATVVLQNTGPGTPPGPPNPQPAGPYTLTVPGLREVVSDIPATVLSTANPSLVLTGGTLVTVGGEFRVASVSASGMSGQLAFAVYAGATVPAAGACTWFPGYQLATPPVPPLAVGEHATAAGAVGVSCADERAYVADTRGDPARVGNEGAVTAPMIVTRQRRSPVATPSAPGSTVPSGQSHLYATAPDYYGRSFYTVNWPPASGLSWLVYRALDDGLFLHDREQRRALSGYYVGRTPFDDDSGFQTWFSAYAATAPGLTVAQLTAPASTLSPAQNQAVDVAWEAWAARFYPALSDTAMQALADRDGNEAAFVRLNAEPVRVAGYDDTLDGRAPSRFFYRTRAVDVAGNQSPLSGSSLPVYVPVKLPPARPALLEAVGGNGSITLRWVENADADLDGYHLYRATSAADAEDIRTMTLHQRIARSPSATLRAGEVAPSLVHDDTGLEIAGRLQVTDEPVPAGTPHHYRLVALNASGVRSEPSAALSGQAYRLPPAPPTLDQPVWDANRTAVALSWSSPDADLECRVERRVLGRQMWQPVDQWLARGLYAYTDRSVDGARRYEYRVRVRDAYGQTNSAFQPQTTA